MGHSNRSDRTYIAEIAIEDLNIVVDNFKREQLVVFAIDKRDEV